MPRPCLSVTQVWDTWLTFETHINSLLLHFSLGSLRWNQSRHGNKSTSTHSGKLLLVKAMIVTTFAGKDTASQTLLHSSTLYRVPPSAASQVLPLIGSIVTVFSLTQTNSLVRVELQTLSDKTPAYFCSLLTVHTITWTLCSWSFMHLFILKVCTIFGQFLSDFLIPNTWNTIQRITKLISFISISSSSEILYKIVAPVFKSVLNLLFTMCCDVRNVICNYSEP